MNPELIDPCLAFRLRRSDRIVTQLYNEHFASVGIRGTQFSVLRALHFMKSTTASQLKEVLVLDQTTMSRALKRLTRDGYIAVAEGPSKREKSLELTAEGEALYQRALVPWQAAQLRLRELLGPEGDSMLLSISEKVAELKK